MQLVKVGVIIQARNGSTRFPRKSMADLIGKPMLHHVIERVKRSLIPDEVVLATTHLGNDDVLESIADACGIRTFRGSVNNLVDRFHRAAESYGFGVVVRVCADNPCIEPAEIDRIVNAFLDSDDYCMWSNTHDIDGNGYPDGLGAEVYYDWHFENLRRMDLTHEEKEHPHRIFYKFNQVKTVECPEEFKIPSLRLDVNYKEDYEYIKGIYEHFGHNRFHITDIIRGCCETGLDKR